MRIVATVVVGKHLDFDVYCGLQVRLAINSAEKLACDVALVTDI